MDIASHEEDGTTVIALKGKLDEEASVQLEEFAGDLLATGKISLTLDMSGCDHLSSEGIRVIVDVQKQVVNGGKLVLRNVTHEVMGTLDAKGFSKILTIEKNVHA